MVQELFERRPVGVVLDDLLPDLALEGVVDHKTEVLQISALQEFEVGGPAVALLARPPDLESPHVQDVRDVVRELQVAGLPDHLFQVCQAEPILYSKCKVERSRVREMGVKEGIDDAHQPPHLFGVHSIGRGVHIVAEHDSSHVPGENRAWILPVSSTS